MIWSNFRIFITCNDAFEFDFKYKLVTFQLYVAGLRIFAILHSTPFHVSHLVLSLLCSFYTHLNI